MSAVLLKTRRLYKGKLREQVAKRNLFLKIPQKNFSQAGFFLSLREGTADALGKPAWGEEIFKQKHIL